MIASSRRTRGRAGPHASWICLCPIQPFARRSERHRRTAERDRKALESKNAQLAQSLERAHESHREALDAAAAQQRQELDELQRQMESLRLVGQP